MWDEISCGLNDGRLGNRKNKLPASVPISLLLRQNFLREIPGEQQRVIGPSPGQFSRRDNRQVRSGRESSLLVGAAVRDELNGLAAQPAVIQKRAAFRGSAVGGDGFAGLLQFAQQPAQISFQALRPLGEAIIETRRGNTLLLFLTQ